MKKLFIAVVVCMTWSLTGLAQDKTTTKKTAAEPTTEQRTQMAAMHEKAALCLRSNKSMTECHAEMMKDCPMHESCTMGMGMWKKSEGMGKGKGGMMGKGGTGTTTEGTTETKEKKSY